MFLPPQNSWRLQRSSNISNYVLKLSREREGEREERKRERERKERERKERKREKGKKERKKERKDVIL